MSASQTEPSFDRSIVEGPISSAVWKLAWPTMLQNLIAGFQGFVDHAMVGRFVGFQGNAAIGVSWQIFLIVVVFVASLYSGMNVLVARFAGAGDREKVNRTVCQAFLTSSFLGVCVFAPVGYFAAPWLLSFVNAEASVQAEALPYLRIMFVFSVGMLHFFMLGGALRAAGDARTPLRLGVMMTVLNITLNVILIRGLGPIPAFGTPGAAMGTVIAGAVVSRVRHVPAVLGAAGGAAARRRPAAEPQDHHRAVPLRPAHRLPGHRHEHRWRHPDALRRLAAAERRGAGGLRRLLHAAVLAGHLHARSR